MATADEAREHSAAMFEEERHDLYGYGLQLGSRDEMSSDGLD
jgi:hypothetical protein